MKRYLFLIPIFIFFIILAFLVRIALPVTAATQTDQSQTSDNNNVLSDTGIGRIKFGQAFIPTVGNINGIAVKIENENEQELTSLQIFICEGDHTDFGVVGSYNTYYDCSLPGHTMVYMENMTVSIASTSEVHVKDLMFDHTVNLTNLSQHYFSINLGNFDDFRFYFDNTDPYASGYFLLDNGGSPGGDLHFLTYYQDDYEDPDVEIVELEGIENEDNVWWEVIGTDDFILSDDLIEFRPETYCIIGNTCRIWFSYKPEIASHTIYLMNDDGTEYDWSGSSIDSTELIDDDFGRDYVNPTTRTAPQDNEYCLYDRHPDENTSLDIVYCGLTVKWRNESTKLEDFFDDYDCDNICDGIATGTDWFNFRYGIECGLNRFACWALVPSDETLIKFGSAVYAIESVFPFSIYGQIKNIFYNLDTSTTTETLTFDFNDWGFEQGDLGNYEELTLASSTMMVERFGTMWNTIYTLIKKILYLFLIIYIIFRAIRLAKGV